VLKKLSWAFLALALAVPTAVGLPDVASAAESPATDTTEQRLMVRRIANLDPRSEVRNSAWAALFSSDPNATGAFLASGGGWDVAVDRAADTLARNNLIIARTLATASKKYTPAVYLAADRASKGTYAQKEAFVATGLAAAREKDAKGGPQSLPSKQAQQDREYVAQLAVNASGPWVRAAAARAAQLGTDAEIEEFFAYSWSSAAQCDIEAFRLDVTEQSLRFRHRLDHLIAAAGEAQTAYESAADAAKVKAAETARTSWNAVGDLADVTQAKWLAEQTVSVAQAQSWAAVRDFALDAKTEQDWPGIADQAGAQVVSWNDEVEWATEQARKWSDLAERARESAAMIPTTGTAA
jgi:hypothetical protein